jgi:hypothetical protein
MSISMTEGVRVIPNPSKKSFSIRDQAFQFRQHRSGKGTTEQRVYPDLRIAEAFKVGNQVMITEGT